MINGLRCHYLVNLGGFFPVTGLFYLYKQCVPNSKWLDLNQEICKYPKAIVFFPFKFTKKYIPDDNIWLEWKVDESGLSEKEQVAFIRDSFF